MRSREHVGVAARWAAATRHLKEEGLALWLALRDPRLPWHARLVTALVVGYAFSPLDLIPDFIPVLGLLDDMLLLPLGIWLALRLVPDCLLAEARAQARARLDAGRPVSRTGAALVVALWALALLLAAGAARRLLAG